MGEVPVEHPDPSSGAPKMECEDPWTSDKYTHTHTHTHIYIYMSCFHFHPASLCLLVRALNQFTFKVIMEMYVLTDTLLIALYFFGRSFFLPFLFGSLLMI